jgi:hypothetical protein
LSPILDIDWGPCEELLEYLVEGDDRYEEVIGTIEDVLSKVYWKVGGPNLVDGQETQIHIVPSCFPGMQSLIVTYQYNTTCVEILNIMFQFPV